MTSILKPGNQQKIELTLRNYFISIKMTILLKSTEGECLFESYLSVLVELLGQEDIYQEINKRIPVIEIDSCNQNYPWMDPKTYGMNKFIFYICNKTNADDDCNETHFKVAMKSITYHRNNKILWKWEIHDPHHHYQKFGSHGFCQMFTHFIAYDRTSEFIDISFTRKTSTRKDIYAINTLKCLRKTVRLIKKRRNLYDKIENVFNEIRKNKKERKHFGMNKKMTFQEFIFTLSLFELKDVYPYILDQYM